MNARERLLARLRERGICGEVETVGDGIPVIGDGDRVVIQANGRISDEMRQRIIENVGDWFNNRRGRVLLLELGLRVVLVLRKGRTVEVEL